MLVPHDVALGVEEGLGALVPLGVTLVALEVEEELVELEEDVEELDIALLVGNYALGFLLEVLPLDCAYRGCVWQWLDLILEGHIALQELVLHVVVVGDVGPRRLGPLGVDALVLLLLDDKDVVVLELEQMQLGLIEDEGLAHRLALVIA